MAISNNKVKVQISMHKDMYEILEKLTKDLNNSGEKVTKSDVIETAIGFMIATLRQTKTNKEVKN